ncbi:MAG: primosomal protein N' [Rickettsiales bacterium]|jgi:primosomal protein N' (replication factor Y)|nr:primosomal protein N' [Rickettsiales bacterium]
MKIAKVVVPFHIYGTFDYESIDDIQIGNFVRVSFSRVYTIGLVIGVVEGDSKNKLKKITEKLEIHPLKDELINFIKWVADYNIIPIGLVLKLVFSEKYIGNTKEINKYTFIDNTDKKITPKQQDVVDFLSNNIGKNYTFDDLKDFCSLNVLKTLVKNGIIVEKRVAANNPDFSVNLNNIKLNKLSDEQNEVYSKIVKFIDGGDNRPILLEGATGSGKTELYFHLFEKMLRENINNQVLFLLPEIALTSQFLTRVEMQFNCENVAIWHSNISDSRKKVIWNGVIHNKIKIVMGARSSLFLPFAKLSLIVIDEEHDGSYKQTDNGCYNARDMAVVRTKLNNCPAVLGSATPSLESLVNVENGKYNYVYLKNRFGKSTMPDIEIINLLKEKPKKDKYLSQKLLTQMKTELDKKNQVLLFMNRRGYAPIAICNECGYRFCCPNCSCCLTVHGNSFICHQCGHRITKQDSCPSCGGENSIIFFGPGVEKIEKEVQETFPDKKTVIITSDTVQNVSEIQNILTKIVSGEIDIIIGTQMITKGYDFPGLTLVGILDADASLFGANFRATERTYQLLTQVIGRAGRREIGSKAIIQSYSADNLIMGALKNNDRDTIINFEKSNRKIAELPPFGKIILLMVGSKDEIKAYRKAKEIISLLPNNSDKIKIYGPTPATMFKLNNEFRFRLIIKTTGNINSQKLILGVLNSIKTEGGIKIKVDVNPYFI